MKVVRQGAKAETEQKHESVLKRFFSAIGKAVGMKPEEIDATVEEIEKGGAETFGTKLAERKCARSTMNMGYVLRFTIFSMLDCLR